MGKHSRNYQKNKFLNIDEFKFVVYEYTKINYIYDEPIDPLDQSTINKIEGILNIPKQRYYNTTLYPTLEKQSSILFYEIIKQHPFINGNKRIACVCLLTNLAINGYWLSISTEKLYEISKLIAESNPIKRSTILKKIENIIRKNLQEFRTKDIINKLHKD